LDRHRPNRIGRWCAGALVLVRVLTEYLTPAQYGQLALGLTVAGLVNQVVMAGMPTSFLHKWRRKRRRML
jgi:O-antigen/teichoic acid export membrane protein